MGRGGSLALLVAQPKSYQGLSTLEIEPDTTVERPRILSILATILEHIVARNEAKQAKAGNRKLTVFHGLRAPAISIEKYLERIFKYANCSPACFVVGYVYIERIVGEHDDMVITSLNVHRLLITCVMIAAKFLDDSYFNNAYYAKVGGVTTAEMNRLEMELLFRMDFRLNLTTDVFYAYVKKLEAEIWNARAPLEACLDVNSLSMLKPPGGLAHPVVASHGNGGATGASAAAVHPRTGGQQGASCQMEAQKGVRTPPREVESYRYPSIRSRTIATASP
eukprot:TRINITY_DN13298_c0_g1_i1.p1 TRINITY_DN13298_c0_g1~~TRINITY_DN13298_c0_g1_i1.p1  ORF type:complete len:279 (-),score=-3.55 TRINITY_DN13298_c0_g1_i1:488-1324(-)